MVESSTHRKFVGTACLYRHLALRKPPFLGRNLDRALDWHEKSLAHRKAGLAASLDRHRDMEANRARDVKWDLPVADVMEELFKGRSPVLKLNGLQLVKHRDPRDQRDDISYQRTRRRRLKRLTSNPDWLPDPSIDFSARCSVTLNIIAYDRDDSVDRIIYADTRRGTIESDDESDAERRFDIRLDEIFSIDAEKIHEVIDQDTRSGLEVTIRCIDLKDSRDLLRMLKRSPNPGSDARLTHKNAALSTSWQGLPRCPTPDSLLALRRENGFQFDYGVDLSMGWTRKRETPLEAYAKARRSALAPDQDQLPTPSASDESEKAMKRYAITYVFANQRYHVMESLKCPLCATEPTQRALREHSSFERLHTHLVLMHDHFHPQIEAHSDNEGDLESQTIRRTVHLWLSDRPVERLTKPEDDGDEEIWVAPARPFDQTAYLRGEDTWTGHPKAKAPGKQGRSHAQEGRKQPASSSARQSAAVQPRPSIPEIKDITDLRKAKYPLPKVPGIRFYRTVSKRPFESDEEVSESDDDVDESWLQARLQDDMKSLSLSDGARAFLQDWNLSANGENFSADKLTREGVVRFARKFQDKFRDEEYRGEFLRFITKLKDHGIIDQEVLAYCDEKTREMSHGLGRRRKGGESREEEAAQGVATEQSGKTCTCGMPVQSARGAIICHDNRCSRVQFHMACVGLTSRPESWRCSNCCALEDGGED